MQNFKIPISKMLKNKQDYVELKSFHHNTEFQPHVQTREFLTGTPTEEKIE